jgi:GT2 family glycosyltransferase
MGETGPLVSVLVLTHNRSEELDRCLQSVDRQTYKRLEVIVVDNASTDGTRALMETAYPEDLYVHLPDNVGCPAGRNIGFTHCKGEYIYQLDDDGWLEPNAVERAVAAMRSDSRIAVVMSAVRSPDGLPRGTWEKGLIGTFVGCCSMLRSQAVRDVGIYPSDYAREGEEADLALRILEAGHCIYYEPESVMYHAPVQQGRRRERELRLNILHAISTGVRLYPAPWHLAKLAAGIWNSFRLGLLHGHVLLPLFTVGAVLGSMPEWLLARRPVSQEAMRAHLGRARL